MRTIIDNLFNTSLLRLSRKCANRKASTNFPLLSSLSTSLPSLLEAFVLALASGWSMHLLCYIKSPPQPPNSAIFFGNKGIEESSSCCKRLFCTLKTVEKLLAIKISGAKSCIVYGKKLSFSYIAMQISSKVSYRVFVISFSFSCVGDLSIPLHFFLLLTNNAFALHPRCGC